MPAPLFSFLHLVIDSEPRPAPMNMAIDEVLLQQAAEPVLRIYRWLSLAVSFGYFEKFEQVRAQFGSREFVRRCTGGGVVPHGRDVTYSLIVPRRFEFSQRDASQVYRVIHERIAVVLRGEGIEACVTSGAGRKTSNACFEHASPHDLTLGGKKIAGAAQRRSRHGLLHQGSIQNLELSARFPEHMAQAFSACFERRVLDDGQLAAASALSDAKYASETWLKKY
jgi:lipoate-protein ligase A